MARLSRRKVVAALGSAPLLADGRVTAAAAADPVLLLCAHYRELARRQELLIRRWGDREAWLGDNRDWFNLSKAEQRALPEAQLIYAIDAEYDRCVRTGVRIIRRLRAVPALTVDGAAAKLSVVAEVIDPEDYPGAHRVLLSAIEDLRAIGRKG
ncbi:MAG: hypothetical protein BroJett013_12120 [Alphaproteobacteria bacterium]|nr:MAG: hypothetical protein BroJett013_12120 [Alphaproteobacteria bacterium]